MGQYILLLFSLAFMACSTGDDEVYVLPKNYVGVVYVIFNQKTGEKEKYDNGKRVYEIPPNGILKTQFPINNGWHGIPKYYYTDQENRIPVFYQLENKDLKVDTVQVCCIQNGSSYNESNEAVQYHRFFIGTKQQIDSVYELEQRRNVIQIR